jgi:hypothetical protein
VKEQEQQRAKEKHRKKQRFFQQKWPFEKSSNCNCATAG